MSSSGGNQVGILLGESFRGASRVLSGLGRIVDGLNFIFSNIRVFHGSISLITASLNQPFILVDHLFHNRQLLFGGAVLKSPKERERDSAYHHETAAYAQYLVSNGALSKTLKIFHVVAIILLFLGALVACFYSLLSFLFCDHPLRTTFETLGGLAIAIGLVALAVILIGKV